MKKLVVLSILVFSMTAQAQEEKPEAAPAATSTATSATVTGDPAATMRTDKDYNVLLDARESRLTLAFYTQLSQFKSVNGALMGYTFEGVASYALSPKLAGQFSMNQALSSKDGISVLYTGFRSSMAYAITGNFISSNNALFVNSVPTVHVKTGERSLIAVEGGVEQVLFNGEARIVPATGLSASGRYDFTIWKIRASAVGRYGMLVLSNNPVTLMTVGVGAMMRF